jgi:endonuclease YncB( thermonuclease family)
MKQELKKVITGQRSRARFEAASARSHRISAMRRLGHCRSAFICVAILLLMAPMGRVLASEFSSYASVDDDGLLRVGNRKVQLYGIYIPPTGNHCRTNYSPPVCGSRASLALDFKIQGFVHCEQKHINRDRSITAVCYVNRSGFSEGEDLAAYLIQQGWALALPHAPFEYHALEKIARVQSAGIWGFTIDGIERRATSQ